MHLADRLELPEGYAARPHRGRDDHAPMASVLTEARRAKGDPMLITPEQIEAAYHAIDDCDRDLDIAMIEFEDQVVAYSRPRFHELTDTTDLVVFAPARPDHAAALFDPCMGAQEAHLRKWIHDDKPARYRGFAGHPGPDQEPTGDAARFEARGYVPVEWMATLRRPHLDDIPNHELPAGIEVRPVDADDVRQILEAHHEAFRGEWDFAELTESSFDYILNDPLCDTSLWQVAWDGDQVVSQVKPFINPTENEARGYARGYTEYISTHHDYRNRGLARALLARALVAIRDRGMTEAVLGVDTNNPGGAFQLYLGLGFELESYEAIYSRPA